MDRNPYPCKDIPFEELAKLMVRFGWDQAVMVYRKEDHNGGEGVTTAGFDYRNGKVAEEMGRFLKNNVMGWKGEGDGTQEELDRIAAQAKAEMSAGPITESGLGLGNKIMLPTLEEKTKRDRKIR